jgi:hypothetical protein
VSRRPGYRSNLFCLPEQAKKDFHSIPCAFWLFIIPPLMETRRSPGKNLPGYGTAQGIEAV